MPEQGSESDRVDVSGEILRTSGVSSVVRDDEGEALGHILMLEWDECENVLRAVDDLDRLPGASVLLQSSESSYHGYNFSVRPWAEQVTDAARKSGDLNHVRASARRGYFVLRILEKFREETGEIYKPAPEVMAAFVSESELQQSRPHLEFFRDLAEEQGLEPVADELAAVLEDGERLVGSGMDVDHYQTGTDEIKRRLR